MTSAINDINDLPSIDDVRKISQGLALVDAIIMPDWEYRYFSFNCNWDGNGNEMMASMRDGSGSEYFLHFSDQGVVGKVLSDELLVDSATSLANIPDCFSSFKEEPAFSPENATFFFWRGSKDSSWHVSPGHLSVYPLLEFLVGGFSGYQSWAEDYYEKNVDEKALEEVFTSLGVTAKQLEELNSELTLEDLSEDLLEIIGSR